MNDKMIIKKDDDYDDVIENTDGNNDDFEEIQVTLKLKKNIAQIGKLIAKDYDEDFDKFVSEEVSKMIPALASSPSILSPPPISDELKQHIQKLLEEEVKEKFENFEIGTKL